MYARPAWLLADVLRGYFYRHNQDAWQEVSQLALSAAAADGDPADQSPR